MRITRSPRNFYFSFVNQSFSQISVRNVADKRSDATFVTTSDTLLLFAAVDSVDNHWDVQICVVRCWNEYFINKVTLHEQATTSNGIRE